MFQKKEYIYSESLGVCRIDNITKLSLKNQEHRLYYVLRSNSIKTKTSYIPVEGHKVKLRKLISREQALNECNNGLKNIKNELELEEIAFVLDKNIEELKTIWTK